MVDWLVWLLVVLGDALVLYMHTGKNIDCKYCLTVDPKGSTTGTTTQDRQGKGKLRGIGRQIYIQ